MSNNKQSRIYQCVELLNKGVNDLDIQTTIIDVYEKVVRKNNTLKGHVEKLILDLQDKKKIISNLEEEIKELNTLDYYDVREGVIKQISEENVELVEKVKRLKTIANALTNSKLKDTQEENLEKCYEALTVTNKENLILRREKNELEDAVNSLLNRDILQENETLKETNKNLLNIGKEIEDERDYYKLNYENSSKWMEKYKEKLKTYRHYLVPVENVVELSQEIFNNANKINTLEEENKKLKNNLTLANSIIKETSEEYCDIKVSYKYKCEENKKLERKLDKAKTYINSVFSKYNNHYQNLFDILE